MKPTYQTWIVHKHKAPSTPFYKKYKRFYKKYKRPILYVLAAGILSASGVYAYYHLHVKAVAKKKLEAIDPFVTTGTAPISEDVLTALQDSGNVRHSIQNVQTGFEYWQGKPVTRKTSVEGTMLLTNNPDSTAVKKEEDPYFVNADIATIEKKLSEMMGAEITLSGPNLPKKFTGYLSTFKKEVLGIGKTPQQEVKFIMEETKEVKEKK